MENVHNAPTSDMVDAISCGKTVERTADDSLKIEIKTLQHLNQDSNDHNPAKDSLTNRLIRLLAGFRGFAFSESQRSTFIFAYQTMGMVYGGLSTTPLYLYSSIPFRILSVDDYLGVLSIIFWTLTLIGGVKYVLIVLHADDHGEGGTFALYSLLRKRTKINTSTHEVCQSKLSFNLIFFIKGSKLIKNFLFSITMLATCMVIGDGVLTPAISVLSAIEGLKVAAPSISQGIVVVVSVLLLVALFLLQRFGTQQISFMFSPIIVTWLTTTPLIGLYNIVMHYPTVYKAISPYYMLKFFSTHGKEGWLALGGTTLCITGAEAMFADLGHFNKASMQLGFLLAVYPSNMITYAGLTAYLIRNPEHQSQAFFKFTPDSLFWPMFIVSTLAAIVASQALISACFSLVKQCVALDCFPRVQIIHTSREHEGQVYSPEVNFSLMALCTAIVIGFHNGSALGNAYGVAVIVVMLITTLLLTMVMIMVWGVSVPVALAFFCFFTFIEACNLSAVLSKVPRGGWLPFMLSCMLAVLVFSWVHGRKKKRQHELSNSISITAFKEMLVQADVKRVPGVCFAYTNAASFPSPHNSTDDASYDANHALKGDYGLDDDNHVGLDARVPPFLQHYVHTAGSLHRVVVLTRVHKARVADVPKADRFVFTIPAAEAGGGGLYICTVQVGYAQRISEQCKGLTWVLLEHLEDFIRTAQAAQAPASSETIAPSKDMGTEARERWEEELAEVERAKQDMGVLACHMVGRAKLKAHQTKNNCVQRLAIDKLYALLQHNCIPALLLEVPTHNLLELNIMYEV